jgi:aspartate/methionine/tyrosine aminotransferase
LGSSRERFVSDRVSRVERGIFYVIQDEARRLEKLGNEMTYLHLGNPKYSLPEHLLNAGKDAMRKGYIRYTGDKGFEDLREAITVNLKKTKGIDVDPITGVVITVGGIGACWAALYGSVNPSDEVILTDPCYPTHRLQCNLIGGRIVNVKLHEELEFNPDIEEVKEVITPKTKVMLINSPNNPTGGVMTTDTLRGLAEISVDEDLFVISDEAYERILFDGRTHLSIASLPGMTERTVVAGSFSKTYAIPGLRVGYLAGSSELVSRYIKAHYATCVNAPSLSQKVVLAALNGPQDWVDEMVKDYERKRNVVHSKLESIDEVTCIKPRSTFYLFPNISEYGMNSFELAQYLVREAGVATTPGSGFGPGGEGHIRISNANVSLTELMSAMDRIEEALVKL